MKKISNKHSEIQIESGIKKNIPLAQFTTLKIGGPASYFIEPVNKSEFKEAIIWSIVKQIPFFVMGKGSNILVHDSGYRGLVICTQKMNKVKAKGTVIFTQCGVEVDQLVDICTNNSLSGLEFAAGLPGTVGGAIFMNARAYSGEFSQIVKRIECLRVSEEGVEEVELDEKALDFGYKKSSLQNEPIYLLKAVIKLEKGEKLQISKLATINRVKRKSMGQFRYPSAGCIFKNDYSLGKSSGKIIDELGLKGTRIGDAEVYQEHANFIINRGNATSEDVYRLIRIIENEAKKRAGIVLEREIILLGNWGDTK